jgi:hypothetical protein
VENVAATVARDQHQAVYFSKVASSVLRLLKRDAVCRWMTAFGDVRSSMYHTCCCKKQRCVPVEPGGAIEECKRHVGGL